MDTPKKRSPHSREETVAPPSASLATKRGGPRYAAGGGKSNPDSVTRCPGATWEMAYFPLTCVTCGLHVCLHNMEIVTRHFAARGLLFRAGRGRAGQIVLRIEPGRNQVPIRCSEPLVGDGCATMSQRSIRSAESESPQPPRRGSLDAANSDEPAYPLSYNGAGEGMAPAPPSNPPRVALPWRSRMGAPPPFPRVGAA